MMDLLGTLMMGVMLFFRGCITLLTGDAGTYHGLPISETSWLPFMLLGLWIAGIAVRALWRGEHKRDKRPTEQDVEQARNDLDRMYLRDHGHLPRDPGMEELPQPEQARNDPDRMYLRDHGHPPREPDMEELPQPEKKEKKTPVPKEEIAINWQEAAREAKEFSWAAAKAAVYAFAVFFIGVAFVSGILFALQRFAV